MPSDQFPMFHHAGLPTVEEGSYEYSDYGEGDYESEEEGKGYSSLTPTITSQPVSTSVDEGMTIRLPCSVDNLPGWIVDKYFIHFTDLQIA